MTATQDDTIAELQRTVAGLRRERDAALAQRNSEYGERMEQQAATIDVLKAMSASPGDPQPVFDQIVRRAVDLCDGTLSSLYEYDGVLVHMRGFHGAGPTAAAASEYAALFPMTPTRGSIMCRAILDRQTIHITDYQADPNLLPAVKALGHGSQLTIPLMRGGAAIGAISLNGKRGGFTDSQIELLNTFAEQAVIAIGSAATYRALQTRTADLQESLEYQTATSDVLKVISGSDFDLEPVFQAVVETAARLCRADQATIYRCQDDEYRWAAGTAMAPDYERIERSFRARPGTGTLVGRVALARRTVQIVDAWTDPLYEVKDDARVGDIRTMLGVPLMRDGAPIGVIALARQRVEPFTERQIELVSTFADQAVIAIENTRLLTEQQEALERQTATSEVLQVINASPGDLAPVFDAVLERALRLCGASFGTLATYDGERIERVAFLGVPPAFIEYSQRNPLTKNAALIARGIATGKPVQAPDVMTDPLLANSPGVRDALVELGGVRALLQVPLLKDGAVVGFIGIWRREPGVFPDKQIVLLEGFAAQAVIAMENARLLTEQREALEQQTATAEVLQVINGSPGDLAPVFDAMLEKGMRLCGAAFGMLRGFDGKLSHNLATRGVPAPLAEYMAENVYAPMGVLAQALEDGRPGQTLDMKDTEGYRAGAAAQRAIADLGGARSIVVVPLVKDQTSVGHFTFYRQDVRAFTDKQIALLENFAAQAVIAMESARLLTEQQEALEQQTATAEVLQVINASSGDLTPVFDTILDKAMRLCEAAFGTFYTKDGDLFSMRAARGLPDAYAAFRRTQQPYEALPGSPPARVQETRAPLQVLDMTAEDAYLRGYPRTRALADLGGARTVLYIPLLKDEALTGIIVIYRQEVRAFSDKQIGLLENFATQAVIAMENARLLGEQREALEQQTATAEVLQVINASPGDLVLVFDTMLEKAMRLCGAAFGSFYTYDDERLHSVVQRGVPPAYAEYRAQDPVVIRPGTGIARVIEARRTHKVLDLMATEAYAAGEPAVRAMVELGGVRTLLSVPLCKDDAVVGLITVYRQEVKAFADKQIALLENFAAQAVIAMENARLINEQREALEQQTATAEVLQVINASPGNLAPVYDAMLEKAMHLCGAVFGSLAAWDGKYANVLAMRGFPPALAQYMAAWGPKMPISPVVAQLSETKRPQHVADQMAGEGYRSGHPVSRAVADLGGARTILHVPLRKDEAMVGYISVYRQEVRVFTDKQIALLENFAAQAVVAMENARLLDEIRQRQEELRVTFENMGDGVAMFDETLRLVAWNHKFQDILDVPDAIIARRPTFPEYVRYLAERGEYGAGADPEEHVLRLTEQVGQYRVYERTRPDGRVIEIRHNPVPGGGFVLIYADITERKRNEAEISAARDAAEQASRTIEAAFRDLKAAQANLIQAEKMASLGQLTAGIAHEIKNPLNFVNNFAALSVDLLSELKETAAPGFAALTDDQRAEIDDVSAMLTSNLEKITEHGKRADGIVRAMLEHSRGSSGERRTVDLNALIDEALNLAYHGARAQDQSFNITLERDFGESIVPIEVNPQDMTRVFLNIFSNGFYAATTRARNCGDAGFMPTLTVTTRDAGEAVEVRVRDNGTGIPADIRDKLFQPFFTTKPTGEGTGLGLSITYDIVTKQHGGSITVDSKIGEYSEFTIHLPRNP